MQKSSMIFRLRVKVCVYFCFQLLYTIAFRSLQALDMVHRLWAHVQQSWHAYQYLLPWFPPSTLVLTLFLFSTELPESWWMDLLEKYCFGLRVPRSLIICPLVAGGSLFLFTSAIGESFPDDAWTRKSSVSIAECL